MTLQIDNNNNKSYDETLLEGENAAYLEMLFENYLNDPSSVTESWQRYFSDMPVPADFRNGATHSVMRKQFRTQKLHRENNHSQTIEDTSSIELETERQQVHVLQLINSYRVVGHLVAYTNPLRGNEVLPNRPELTLENYGLDKVDKDKIFDPGSFQMKVPTTLGNIFRALRNTYTESIGIEYMHMMSIDEKRWLQSRIEPCQARPDFNNEKKSELLDYLTAAET